MCIQSKTFKLYRLCAHPIVRMKETLAELVNKCVSEDSGLQVSKSSVACAVKQSQGARLSFYHFDLDVNLQLLV